MSGSYVIITGGLGGLGSAFADECARRGMNLILIDRHSDADAMLAYFREHHQVNVRYFSCDLTSEKERLQLIKTFGNEGIKFSGLINVVGKEFEGPFIERTREEVKHMLDLNLGVMLNLTLSILKMRDLQGRFLLINVASLGGFFPMPNKAVYSSTKRFIINFTLALRSEISEFANVMVLCPGGLPTNPESMKKIFLQGFWGKMTAQDTAFVVRRALNRARRNKPMYIPGLASKFLVWLSRILPSEWAASLLSRRWKDKIDALEFWRITDQQRGK
jgi:short-subunit dehydrogenase